MVLYTFGVVLLCEVCVPSNGLRELTVVSSRSIHVPFDCLGVLRILFFSFGIQSVSFG